MIEEELSPIAKKIVSLLVFEESYDNIVSEAGADNSYIIADEIKTLIGKDIIKPCKDLESDSESGMMYDSDKMKDYSFRLTAKGLEILENLLKS